MHPLTNIYIVVLSCLALAGCGQADNSATNTNHQTNEQAKERPLDSPQSCVSEDQEMLLVKGGPLIVGNDSAYPEESGAFQTEVDDFWISKTEVTNAQFAEFVAATNYVTMAERDLNPADFPDIPPELLKTGSAVFVPPAENLSNVPSLSWWKFIEGAYWRAPLGPGSTIADRAHYPVVHIAFEDALAYAKWKGHRLVSEAEHEYAAKLSGLDRSLYAWGNEYTINGVHQANTWQGAFPFYDVAEDGHSGVAPVGCFPPNNYGVHDLIGNVWEWTSSAYYPDHTPMADAPEQGLDPNQPGIAVRVIKGGSFLCASNFCMRYRPAARQAQDTGLGTNHIGFRTAKSA